MNEDLDKWMTDFIKRVKIANDPDANLPENVWRAKDGFLYMYCSSCKTQIIVDPEWIVGYTSEDYFENWCGRNEYCCP